MISQRFFLCAVIFILFLAAILLWLDNYNLLSAKKTTRSIEKKKSKITKNIDDQFENINTNNLIHPQAKMFGISQYSRNLLIDFKNQGLFNIFLGSGFYQNLILEDNKLELILGDAFIKNENNVYNLNATVSENKLVNANGCILFPEDDISAKDCSGLIQFKDENTWRVPAFKNINSSKNCCQDNCDKEDVGFEAVFKEQFESKFQKDIQKIIPYSTKTDLIRGGLILFAKENKNVDSTFFGYFQIQAYTTSDKLIGKNLEIWTGIQWATLYPALERKEQTLKMVNPVFFNYPTIQLNKSKYASYCNFKNLQPNSKLIRIRLCSPETLFEDNKYFKYNSEKISYVLFSPKLFDISASEPIFAKISVNSFSSNIIYFNEKLPYWVKIPDKINILDPRLANKILYQAFFPEKIYLDDSKKCKFYNFKEVKDRNIKLRNLYSDYECLHNNVNKEEYIDFFKNYPQIFVENDKDKIYVIFWNGEHVSTGQIFKPNLLNSLYLYDINTKKITMKNIKN